jgi:ATP-dependent RNA helicase DDX19/DBP5
MSTAEETPAKDAVAQESVAEAQVDGSGPPGNGADLAETEFNVEVKLADLQADPNNPLFSAKSFEELQLYAPKLYQADICKLTGAGPMSSSRAFVT